MQEFKLGKQVLRIISILLLGLIPFYTVWENDEMGLMQFFAHIIYVLAVFILAIPILLIKNPIEKHIKIFLIFMTVVLATIVPFTNVGYLKEQVKQSIIENKVEKIENTFSVKLKEEDRFSVFENHLLKENDDKTFSIIDKKGEEVERLHVTAIAKEASKLLPLTDDQKENTYYDGYYVEERDSLIEEDHTDAYIRFDYVTEEQPSDFDEMSIPNEATKVKYHHYFSFKIMLDEKGEVLYKKNQLKEEYVDFTYTARGIEFGERVDRAPLSDLEE